MPMNIKKIIVRILLFSIINIYSQNFFVEINFVFVTFNVIFEVVLSIFRVIYSHQHLLYVGSFNQTFLGGRKSHGMDAEPGVGDHDS